MSPRKGTWARESADAIFLIAGSLLALFLVGFSVPPDAVALGAALGWAFLAAAAAGGPVCIGLSLTILMIVATRRVPSFSAYLVVGALVGPLVFLAGLMVWILVFLGGAR